MCHASELRGTKFCKTDIHFMSSSFCMCSGLSALTLGAYAKSATVDRILT